jgi:hypothetical protein
MEGNELEYTGYPRKRTPNKKKWKRVESKARRNAGQEYISRRCSKKNKYKFSTST